MQITDIISITELSRLLKKSRPTVYKYVSDFESGREENIPHSVRKLFTDIQSGKASKRDIYAYCDHWFAEGAEPKGYVSFAATKEKTTTLKDLVRLLKTHERKLDFTKIKNYIEEEIKK